VDVEIGRERKPIAVKDERVRPAISEWMKVDEDEFFLNPKPANETG
jgi:hypothetical protein